MSDPLLDFLLTRDRDKVLAEARPASLEALYAEASAEDRAVIDVMPVGVLRRRLLEAERAAAFAKKREQPVRVIGNLELVDALRKSNAERDRLLAKVAELRRMSGVGDAA